ncbi:MAG: hypothetical protein FWC34_00615, partial [Bacteroidetes bacterium]|nr:hypothetical protein [Bacteroidota bacterium]
MSNDNSKLIAYLHGEKLSQLITTVIVKSGFALIVPIFVLHEASFITTIVGFLAFYSLFTLFVIALRITRNYLLAFIGMFALGFGIAWILDRLHIFLGGSEFIAEILIGVI